MQDLDAHIHSIVQQAAFVRAKCGRMNADLQIVAVSKGQTPERMRAVFNSGIHHFGENYLQEFLKKKIVLQDLPIIWHFIGRLQTNKCRQIAQNFDWVHSVTDYRQALLLDQFRNVNQPRLNICLQINVDPKKEAGLSFTESTELAHQIKALAKIRLRGLMVIPAQTLSDAERENVYRQLQQHLLELNTMGLALDTLSMGMSQDFIIAIKAGATLVRLGSIIFGERG